MDQGIDKSKAFDYLYNDNRSSFHWLKTIIFGDWFLF